MRAAIIGYGKMGRQIERILQERGHEITLRVDEQNTSDLDEAHLRSADVALEFTTPATAFDNAARCIGAGTPVVCGTTGWNDRLPEAERLCREQGGALFYASNFCLGVNLMFRFNRRLAAMMARTEFGASIIETHHIHKKDAPSGTAITLAEGMAEASAGRWRSWTKGNSDYPTLIGITSVREGEIPGIHTVAYDAADESLALTHTIKNRRALALGAVLAAEFLCGKRGVYTMDDLLE